MNCLNCGKELAGRKGKMYCNYHCRNEKNNVRIKFISTRLWPQNLEKVLALQKELLKEQERIENELN